MLVCAFNAILFILLSWYSIRDYRSRRTGWGGYCYAWVVVLCAILFTAHLGNDFAPEFLSRRISLLDICEIGAKYLIAPVMAHLFYRSEKEYLPVPGVWRSLVVVLYLLGIAFAAAEVNVGVSRWSGGWPGWSVARPLFRTIMIVAAMGTGLALWSARRPDLTPLTTQQRRWMICACGAWAGTFLVGIALPNSWNAVLEKLIPLCFIFIVTYYVERFTFFDVLVKKGAFVFASLLLLAFYFVAVPPLLSRIRFATWAGTLVWALSIWPLVLIAPWGHRKLSGWIDRHFLGRPFSPAQAAKWFLVGLQGTINETELAREAETRLTKIFRAQAEVRLGVVDSPLQNTDDLIAAPVCLKGKAVGAIRVHRAGSHLRFLSEDSALLASLAEGFAFLLENLRLREIKLEQEHRERELILNANRLELKALRAQINPHFLFNALNTIASLIPRNPDRAEETVEELAEVFRFTLHRSEREWVLLEEELDAVRAYLHIEQARFREGLRFAVESQGDVKGVRVPAMVVQTLVENSIKHGVATLTSRTGSPPATAADWIPGNAVASSKRREQKVSWLCGAVYLLPLSETRSVNTPYGLKPGSIAASLANARIGSPDPDSRIMARATCATTSPARTRC
jgi:hypothetical protein